MSGISKRDAEALLRNLRVDSRKWTQREDAELAMHYSRKPVDVRATALALARTPNAIRHRAQLLGLKQFETPEELRAWRSEERKQWLEAHAHASQQIPEEHSDAVKSAQSERARQPRKLTEEQRQRRARHAAGLIPTFTNRSGGRRSDIGGMYFRSSWEANYARYLIWLVAMKQIAGWEYESRTFIFEGISRGTMSYTPDFKVTHADGSHEWHEVKGWMDAKSATRLRRMEKYFPEERVRVIDQAWFKNAARTVAGLIPNWESRRDRRQAALIFP